MHTLSEKPKCRPAVAIWLEESAVHSPNGQDTNLGLARQGPQVPSSMSTMARKPSFGLGRRFRQLVHSRQPKSTDR